MQSPGPLFEAITTLFNPQSSSDHKKQANLYLETTSKSMETWSACRSLIERSDIDCQVQFFCCNMLYQKVKREWSALPEHLQTEINNWLSSMLSSIATGSVQNVFPLVIQRLSATLGASASLTPNGVTSVVSLACQLLQSHMHPTTISVAIHLLTPLPQEVTTAAIPRRILNKRKSELSSQATQVLSVVTTLLTQQGSPCFIGGAQDEKMCVNVLKCAREWAHSGFISLALLQTTATPSSSSTAPPSSPSTTTTTHMPTPPSSPAASAAQSSLLSFLLKTLVSSQQVDIVVATSDLLVSSMQSESQWISDTSPGDQTREHASAVQQVMLATLATRPKFLSYSSSWDPQSSSSDQVEALCRGWCRVATRIGEISSYYVARGAHEVHLQLVQFLLECTSSPIRNVAILSSDFWNSLNEVPTLERHQQLREPVYETLLSTVVSQCRFIGNLDLPSELVDLDKRDERYGAFRQESHDLLENTYYLLRHRFFRVVVARMFEGGGGDDSWRDKEASMWTIHAVSRVFVQQQKAWFDQRKSASNGTTASLSSVASGGGAVAPLNPTEHERCSQSSSMMAEMLVRIASDPNSFRHPLLVRTIADTMASLATWIDLHSELTATTTALQATLSFLVSCLGSVTGAGENIATSLQRVLAKCGRWILQTPSMLPQLIQRINQSSSLLTADSRRCLIAGLATVVVKLPTKSDVRSGLETLVGPVLERMEASLQTIHRTTQQMQQMQQAQQTAAASQSSSLSSLSDVVEAAARSTCDELVTFATAMNHVDTFKTQSRIQSRNRAALQEVAGTIMQRAWPAITSAASVQRSDVSVATFSLFNVLVRSLTPLMDGYVATVVESALISFQTTLSGTALLCLTSVVESYGETQSEQHRAMLLRLFDPISTALSGGPSVLASRAETVREFFLLLHRIGLFSPTSFGDEVLSRIIPMAIECTTLQEFKPAQQVLLVLVLFLKLPQKIDAMRISVDRVMATSDNGRRLAMTLLTSIATTAPSRLVSQHSEVVYCLACRYTSECQQWVFEFLASVPETTLSGDTKRGVMGVLFDARLFAQDTRRHKKRFKSLLADLSKVCRREETQDVLADWMVTQEQLSGSGGGGGSSSSSGGGGGVIDLS